MDAREGMSSTWMCRTIGQIIVDSYPNAVGFYEKLGFRAEAWQAALYQYLLMNPMPFLLSVVGFSKLSFTQLSSGQYPWNW